MEGPQTAVWVLLMALTLASLWRELRLQYALAVMAIMFGISALGWLVLKDTCWWLPLIVLNSRGVGRLMLFRWRERAYYGWWVMALACGLSMVLVPGWISLVLALAMQVASVPWLIKRRSGKDAPTYFSVVNWVLLGAWIYCRHAFV